MNTQITTQALAQSGTVSIKEHSFVWVRMNDGEICGHLETKDNVIVAGSYGFWRTNNAEAAANRAAAAFLR